MPAFKTCLNRRLTPREAVWVVVGVAALAAVGFYGYKIVAAKVLESKVEAALPKVRAALP